MLSAVVDEPEIEKYNHNHGVHGRFAESPFSTGIKLKPSTTRAFNGKQVNVKAASEKLETGTLGEKIAIQYARQFVKGAEKASPLRPGKSAAAHDPVDIIGDHKLIESKAGLVSNTPNAQQWNSKIGAPPKYYQDFSAAEKTEFNNKLRQAILLRKNNIVKEASKATGARFSGLTIASIVNPDTGVADIHVFQGFHLGIGWKGEAAKSGYVGSFKYK